VILLTLYRAATHLGGPLIEAQLRRRVARAKEDAARLGERRGQTAAARPDGPLIWLHGASVGESLAMLPLIDGLLAARPALQVLVTTGTTTSARLMAERLPAQARHQFAPVDRAVAWRAFLAHWRPDLALLIESELWPNLILEARARGVPLALVNGRMSERSFRRWRRLPGTISRLLGGFALCLAQSEADRRRFAALGAPEVAAAGNLKHAAPPLPVDGAALAALRAEIGARPLWLAASTHPGEEEQLLAVHARLRMLLPDLLLVIVPRHPERGGQLAELIRAHGLPLASRSTAAPVTAASAVYLADTLGELGLFYRLAGLALIGGSLVPHGGQNPLEAARLGCVPLFGPHTGNFAEITAALEGQGVALRVADGAALQAALARLLQDPAERAALGARAMAAAGQEQAVLDRTLAALAPLLAQALGPADAGP
jgi:3-deoxy-D-manno-octulosonic-acid transferase